MPDPTRRVLRISGADHRKFLQDLVTNDLKGLETGLVYAAILTPQGKYLFDFFLVPAGESILIDVAADRADALAQRLTLYKLRADVVIEPTEIVVSRGLGASPEDAHADPRHDALGWRSYIGHPDGDADWDTIRATHCIPQTGIELIPDQSYILECGFERLHGVDFRKGCYVGQEVTARMKHKTELRKGLATLDIEGAAPIGTEIMAAGKPAGTLFTQGGGKAIAYLRVDRATDEMNADDARLIWSGKIPG